MARYLILSVEWILNARIAECTKLGNSGVKVYEIDLFSFKKTQDMKMKDYVARMNEINSYLSKFPNQTKVTSLVQENWLKLLSTTYHPSGGKR